MDIIIQYRFTGRYVKLNMAKTLFRDKQSNRPGKLTKGMVLLYDKATPRSTEKPSPEIQMGTSSQQS